ncbi:MAG: hypothetical protein HY744_33835 [Deltaproteobacteria bacterium]|nr:hypothetical protein [Deltaproteobacteria bacterium]
MDGQETIRAVELVRCIRDEQAAELGALTREQVLAFFRRAGEAARAEARRMFPAAAETSREAGP